MFSDDIDHETQIVLTNALYFKATWETFFDKRWTRAACFHTPRGCVDVDLMQLIDIFPYGQTQHAQIVQLNYAVNFFEYILPIYLRFLL